ncbi:MAG: hypothetical protein ABFS30_17720, partial [Pseudomonadota bacterium]
LIDRLKDELGYVSTEQAAPTDTQIRYAEKVADTAGVPFPPEARGSRRAASAFIARHQPDRAQLGKCPVCKKGHVIVYESAYACSDKACGFRVWRSNVERFVANFGLSVPDIEAFVKDLLKRKKTLLQGLRSARGNVFDAHVGFAATEGGKHWKLDIMSYARKKPAARNSFS